MPTNGPACIQAYRKIAELYHDEEDLEAAYSSMRRGFDEHPTSITNIEINLILELAISLKKYVEAVKVFEEFSKITFIPPSKEKTHFDSRESLSKFLVSRKGVDVPSTLPADIHAKLMIVFIHLGAFDLSTLLLPRLIAKPVETFGDLYLDVAEAYMAKARGVLALDLLTYLVSSPSYSQAAVWLRYAECLYLLQRYEEAAVAYEKVVKLAPTQHSKTEFIAHFSKAPRSEDALLTLDQEHGEEKIDHYLLAEKCNIYMRQNMAVELIETALFLFQRHCLTIRSKEDALGLMASQTLKRFESMQHCRAKIGESPDDKRPNFSDKPSKIESEWKIYLGACQVCLNMERYDLLERFTHTAWSSELFLQNKLMEECLRIHCYLAAILNMDQELLSPHVKYQSINAEELSTPVLRNLFARAIQRYDYVRYARHLNRLLTRSPEDYDFQLLRAHHNFSCGNYKTAVTLYFKLHSTLPDNPLIILMIVTCLLSIIYQKATTNRPLLATQVVAFSQKYLQARGECQESYYNVGRALHSLGMYQSALTFYKRGLEIEPVATQYPKQKIPYFGEEQILDLRNDIIFNIAKLYENVGLLNIARSYLSQIRV